MLQNACPDLIAITGDLVDSRHTDLQTALAFVQAAVEIAPVFYVTGNHEARIADYAALETGLRECGATVLRDAWVEITVNGSILRVAGLDDPAFSGFESWEQRRDPAIQARLENILKPQETYTLLLSHRPELFDVYCDAGADLVLAGHAHGGQIRLPFLGGLIAPNQGLFPEYDGGLYSQGNTAMAVSRGVGNSIFPLRIGNPPEVVVVELQAE